MARATISNDIFLLRSTYGHEPFVTESIGREGMLDAVLILGVSQARQRGVGPPAGHFRK